MSARHFLTLMDFSGSELGLVVARACELKAEVKAGRRSDMFRNKTLAMIFDKSSTRTRVSFEAAMTQCGGNAIFLQPGATHLGRGEPVEDTARVMSRMVDAVVIRTVDHDMVETFAKFSRVPVINGLTDDYHPCQLLADIQTYQEQRGDIGGRTVAWIGDGNNVCHSWMNAAHRFDFSLRVATPEGYAPNAAVLDATRAQVEYCADPRVAVRDADVVVTDTWVGMGQEKESSKRLAEFSGYRVDQSIMQLAKPDALFMHCLPAYRGYEVTQEVLEGEQSVVWDQAENRLHAQKALLEFLFG